MRRWIVVAVLCSAGCKRADLDADAVKAKSHALLDASDRDDAAAVAPMLGASFVRFESQRWHDRKRFLDGLRAAHAPAVTRTWNEEHVVLGDGTARRGRRRRARPRGPRRRETPSGSPFATCYRLRG